MLVISNESLSNVKGCRAAVPFVCIPRPSRRSALPPPIPFPPTSPSPPHHHPSCQEFQTRGWVPGPVFVFISGQALSCQKLPLRLTSCPAPTALLRGYTEQGCPAGRPSPGRGLKSVGFISSQQPEPQTGGAGPARAPASPLSEEGLEEGPTKRAGGSQEQE